MNMRKIYLDSIKGKEILAKEIVGDYDNVLMAVGTVVRIEYLSRLKELGIQYIYVEDDIAKGVNNDEMTEVQIKNQCQATVKETLEKYTYCGNAQLEKLRIVAEDIIYDVLEQKEVMFNISGVRQKSERVYSHSISVCALSVLIALKLKLPKNKVREIAVGSLLHDIGYYYVPYDLKDLKYDDFTIEEINQIKKHVMYGYMVVENETWLSSVSKDIILSHHEYADGSGYPFHLSKSKIKVGSKIVAVCNEFDRLVYGNLVPAIKVHEAIDYIISQSGIKFDMEIVNVFIESVAAYPNGTIVVTNENEIGIVLKQNHKCPTRPVIHMLRDQYGNEYKEWVEKDLTSMLTLFIQDTIDTI